MTFQRFLAQPRFETPLTLPTGRLTVPWYQHFVSIFSTLGGGRLNVGLATYAQQSSGGGRPVALNDSARGGLIGNIAFLDTPGAAGQVQVLGASPFSFTTPIQGTLVTSGGNLAISRGAFTWSVAGGAIPLAAGDTAQVSWTGGAPTVVWLPRGN